MHPLIQELIARGPVTTDGAWGTELQSLGLALGEFPDAWNLTHPKQVGQVAQSYVDAGSQIILTNTFGANRIRLAGDGLADHVVEINKAGVQISKSAAAPSGVRVFASIGPSGAMLMTGDVAPEALQAAFAEQAQALADGGADGLVIETMSDLEEAKLAVAGAKTTGLPIVACMVFDSGKAKDRTMMGNTPEEAAEALAEAGADVIGANCGQGIAGFVSIAKRFRTATPLPLWIKGNAGLPQVVDGKARYQTTPEEFASHVPALLAAGANFIGGCCGTRPDFIRAVRNALR